MAESGASFEIKIESALKCLATIIESLFNESVANVLSTGSVAILLLIINESTTKVFCCADANRTAHNSCVKTNNKNMVLKRFNKKCYKYLCKKFVENIAVAKLHKHFLAL